MLQRHGTRLEIGTADDVEELEVALRVRLAARGTAVDVKLHGGGLFPHPSGGAATPTEAAHAAVHGGGGPPAFGGTARAATPPRPRVRVAVTPPPM